MGDFSLWHWIIILIVVAWAFACGRILKRIGFNPWWAILAVFPLFSFIGIWIVASVRWPIERRT